MKKILLFLIIFSFISCVHKDEIKTEIISGASTYSSLRFNNGIISYSYDIREFEYKGHTYIYCDVKNGIAPTHAGHCKCAIDDVAIKKCPAYGMSKQTFIEILKEKTEKELQDKIHQRK